MAAWLKDARQHSSDEDTSGDGTTPSPADIFVLLLFISLFSNSWFSQTFVASLLRTKSNFTHSRFFPCELALTVPWRRVSLKTASPAFETASLNKLFYCFLFCILKTFFSKRWIPHLYSQAQTNQVHIDWIHVNRVSSGAKSILDFFIVFDFILNYTISLMHFNSERL